MARPTAEELRSTPVIPPGNLPIGEDRDRRSKRPTAAEIHGAAPPFEPAVPGGKPEPESPAVAKSRRELEEAQTAERVANAEKAKLARIESYAARLKEATLWAHHHLVCGNPGEGKERIFRDLRRVQFLERVQFDAQKAPTGLLDLINSEWTGLILLTDGLMVYCIRPAPDTKDSFMVPMSNVAGMHPMTPGA